jgi:hypothetical protein
MHTLTALLILAAIVSAVGALLALINFLTSRFSDDTAAIVCVGVVAFLVLCWFVLTESISRDLGLGGLSQPAAWSLQQTILAASLAIGLSGFVTLVSGRLRPGFPQHSDGGPTTGPVPSVPTQVRTRASGPVVRILTSPGAGALQCVLAVVGIFWQFFGDFVLR